MSDAKELLYYSSNKLLFSADFRKIMDKQVKDFLGDYHADFSRYQLGNRNRKPQARQADNPSDVPEVRP